MTDDDLDTLEEIAEQVAIVRRPASLKARKARKAYAMRAQENAHSVFKNNKRRKGPSITLAKSVQE